MLFFDFRYHFFDICMMLCIAFLLIYGLFRKITGKKGTWYQKPWKQQYNYLTDFLVDNPNNKSVKSKRRPPRESRGEVECRKVLEEVFQVPFNKARPDFLRNPVTGGDFNLELDCYNPDLKIAVEYNGIQHYKFIPFFHKNKEGFLNQKYRDDMKRRICKENGILLIEIPYNVNVNNIRNYLIEELVKNNVLK